ncbi:MAG: hypothetical protein NC092_04545 [Butyrivibrio sp.]|nr:hypothetical protein [Muribaculum sp.]MCM1551943.1 hypothetical protein [Butyrivibrio sp.]
MAYKKYTYTFPGTREIEYKYKGRYGAKGEKRQPKKKATPEQIRKQNQWNREKRMRRLMKANFSPGDLWCTLKYPKGTRKPLEEVIKDFRNFRGRLKRRYIKHGEKLKFVYRMEIGSRGGIHIHLLVNRIRGDPDAGKGDKPPDTALIIQEAWEPCGRVHYEPVYAEGLFQNLAVYMTKQPDDKVEEQLSFLPVEERKKLVKTDSSRNLTRPEPEVREYGHWTMRKVLADGPKPGKGYYIDPDSIICGVNPVTGMSYLQYIEYELAGLRDTGADTMGTPPAKEPKRQKRRKDGMKRREGIRKPREGGTKQGKDGTRQGKKGRKPHKDGMKQSAGGGGDG